ncbi:MAG: AAA family ATPase [Terriglobales bacterium]
MRFERLDLIAFGPFRGQGCDLPSQERDFCVFHGPNEAGKSSLLRAITALLYGIDAQSQDNFRVNYHDLRLGATLASNGNQIAFRRRKGTKETLLAGDSEAPLPQNALAPFLNGVDRDRFRRLYGLDRTQLDLGGCELASGTGDGASDLFIAGGLLGINSLLQRLETEADAIFSPTAKSKPLNAAIKRFDDAKHAKRNANLSLAGAKMTLQHLHEAKEKVVRLGRDVSDCDQRRRILERVQSNLSDLAKLRDLKAQLASLATVQRLPPEAAQDRKATQAKSASAQDDSERLHANLQRRGKLLDGTQVNSAVLDRGGEIDSIGQDIGKYRNYRSDLENRLAEARAADASIEACLVDHLDALPLETARKLTGVPSAELRQLVKEDTVLGERERQQTASGTELELKLAQAAADLGSVPEPPAIDKLDAAVNQIRRAGDLDANLSDAEAEASTAEEKLASEVRSLGWTADSDALAALAAPLSSTLDGQRKANEKIDASAQEAVGVITSCTGEIDRLNGELSAPGAGADAPSEDELSAARAHRDALWKAIADFAFKGSPSLEDLRVHAGDDDVVATYGAAVTGADKIADRRFDASGVLGRRKKLQEDLDLQGQRLRAARSKLETARRDEEEQRQVWVKAWAPPLPRLSPAEAQEWLAKRQVILQHHDKAQELRSKAQRLRRKRADSLAELGKRLIEVGEPDAACAESLGSLLERAERVCARLESMRQAREQAATEQRRCQSELELSTPAKAALTSERAEWKQRWAQASSAFAPLVLTPANAQERLDNLRTLRDLDGKRQNLAHRIAGMQSFCSDFEKRVHAAAEACDLHASAAADSLATQLAAALKESNEASIERKSISGEIEREKGEIAEAKAKAGAAAAEIRRLCQQAGVEAETDLPQAEQQSQQRSNLEGQIAHLRQSLLGRNGGKSLDEIEQEAQGQTAESVGADLAEANRRLAELQQQRDEAVAADFTAQQNWEKLGDSEEVAKQAQLAANAATEIRELAPQYVRLRLSAEILRRAIASYREKNQAPVLKCAGEMFSRMSGGAFASLSDEYGDDHRILKAKRSASTEIVEQKGLSGGTRDQLFLALRLAILEHHRGADGGMPLVLDEILEGADEQRARAILAELAEFSRKQQVLLLTHHAHIAEAAVAAGAHLVAMPPALAVAAG